MPLHPRVPNDLMLAPVAVAVDQHLEEFRDQTPAEILAYLELELDRPEVDSSVAERTARVLAAATRNANMHDWDAVITDDHCRLRITGGSVTLDIGLSASIHHFIEGRL